MNHRAISLLLATGQVFAVLLLFFAARNWHLPANQQGYAPLQPILFSHRLHAGELAINGTPVNASIDCGTCHH